MPESPVLKSVRDKVEKLVDENRRLRADYAKVAAQREKLQVEQREQAEMIAALEKRIGVLELREGFSGAGEDSRAARIRINRLMREVDKCIALLNR